MGHTIYKPNEGVAVVVVDTLGQARVSDRAHLGPGTEILEDGDPRHNYKPDIMN